MIGHRAGHAIKVCDGCYRPKRTGEKGWQHSDEGGFPPSTARPQITTRNGRSVPGPEVEQPEQGLDYCPDCVLAPRFNGSSRA